jgi:uncharacterized protein (TIGR02757 family)
MKINSEKELYELLEEKYYEYCNPFFIETDPISIPHKFNKKEDIEISGFFSSTIAWGQRKTIIANATKLMNFFDNSPYQFIIQHNENDLKKLQSFVHRTFNGDDCIYFVESLKNIYDKYNGLENVFSDIFRQNNDMFATISRFNNIFFSLPHLKRTEKHISNPEKGSAAKRINMFLRWMVRNDNRGVDFGLWKKIPVSALLCPLDLHSANTARKLGIISRKQNDRKTVEELMITLRKFDKNDPVKYDFALFGIGAFEKNNRI